MNSYKSTPVKLDSLKPTPLLSQTNSVSTTCASVLALTPEDNDDCVQYSGNVSSHNSTPVKSASAVFDNYNTSRTLSHSLSTSAIMKNPRIDISCFTLPDSDSEGHHSPLRPLPNFTNSVMSKVIKPEPQKENLLSASLTDVSKSGNQMINTSQKKRLLAKAQQQAHIQNLKQIPQIRIDNFSSIPPTKQELISSEDEDSLCGRVNYLNASTFHHNNNVSNNRRYNDVLNGQYLRNPKIENLEGEKLIKCAVSPTRVCTLCVYFALFIYLFLFSFRIDFCDCKRHLFSIHIIYRK